jgi:hypothetical protein
LYQNRRNRQIRRRCPPLVFADLVEARQPHLGIRLV